MESNDVRNFIFFTIAILLLSNTFADSSQPGAPHMNEFKFLKDEYVLGENASAVCIALSGRQPFHFRWLKNGLPLTTRNGRVSVTSIALVSTLEVQDSRSSDHANYTCEVSNAHGRATHSAALRITAPPTWTFVSDNVVVPVGHNVTIRCEADGQPPPLITWKFAKPGAPFNELSVTDNLVRFSRNNTHVEIDRVQRMHEGSFRCQASSSNHEPIVREIKVEIQYPPVFQYQQPNISAAIGSAVDLRCEIDSSIPAELVWHRLLLQTKDNSMQNFLYPDGSQRNPIAKKFIGTGERVQLHDLRTQDAGLYECVATNPINQLKTNHIFRLAVKAPARLQKANQIVHVRRDEHARLQCTASGERPMKIEWLRQLDDGSYSALFDRNLMPVSSDLEPLASSRRSALARPDPELSNSTCFELQIASAQMQDSGSYLCKVTNEFGDDSGRLRLIVQDVPDAPKELVINQVWSRSVSLRWTVVQQDGQSPLIGYVIEYWRERADPNSISGDSDVISSGGSSTTVQMTDEKLPVHRLHEVHVPASQTKITLNEHLRPGLWYRVRVYAQNHLGRSRTAIERRLATQQEEPTLPPTDLRLLSRSSRRLALGWQAPPLDSWNGPLTGYLVGYRALDKKELQLAQERRLPPSSLETSLAFNTVRYQPVDPSKEQKPAHHHDDTIVDQYSQRYELESLQPATAYYVVVRAMNRVGQGPFSQPLLLFTSTVDPPSAPEVSLDSVDRNSLTIRWRLAAGDRKQITHYLISYREQQKSAQWLQRSVEAGKVPDDRFTLTALNEATSYEVVVRAAAGSELSEPSTILRLNTRTSDKSGAAFGLAERIANFRLLGSTSAAAGSTASATPLPAFFRAHVIVPLSIAMVAITLICAVAFGYVKHEEKKTALIQASMGRMAGSPSKHFQYMASASTMMGGGGGGHMPHAGPMNGGSDSSNASNSLLSSTYQTIGGPNVNDSLLSEEGSISLRYSDADKSKPLFSARPNNCSVAPGAISAAWVTNKPMGSIVEESEVMSAADEDGFPAPYSTLPMQKMTTFGQASFGETVRPNNQGPPLPSSQPPPLPANRPPSFVRIGSPVRNIQINPLGHVMNPPNAAQLVFNDFNSSANLLNLSVGADETPSVFNSTINASSSQPLLPPPMVDGSPFGAHIRHLQAEIHQPDDSDSYDFFRPTQI